jgi:hypothetical protein
MARCRRLGTLCNRLAFEWVDDGKDRLDPVDLSATLELDEELLIRFPEGYCHLAYLQSKNGFTVKENLPGLRGPAVEKLYAEGKTWLAGSVQPGDHL